MTTPPHQPSQTTHLWRWLLVAGLFSITVINYVDRQSLSLLAPELQSRLHMTDLGYANVVVAFLLAYTIAYVLAGWLCDRLGARRGLTFFVLWWSLAELLPPFVRNTFQLGGARFLLGLGEAGNYVAAPKAIREHFAPAQSGLALGIYTAGATLGATLAPPLIASLSVHHGWQSVFFVTGIAGIVWLGPWLWITSKLPHAATPQPATEEITGSHWSAVLHSRTVWLLLAARFLTDPVWYFLLFWFPKYLQQARGLSLSQTGRLSWVVYLAADIGSLAGGYVCGPLIRRGLPPLIARRRVMLCAAMLMPLSALIILVHSIHAVLAIASVLALAHMAWLVVLTAIVLDQLPASITATAAGVIAAGSGLGGMLASELLGRLIPGHGYTPAFLAACVLHPLALLLIWRIRSTEAPALPKLSLYVPPIIHGEAS